MSFRLLLLWPIFALLCARCAGDPERSDGPTVQQQGPESGLCSNESGEIDIRGQWAIRAELDVEGMQRDDTLISLCPQTPLIAAATAWVKLAYTDIPDGGEVSHVANICALDLPIVTAAVGTCPSDPADYLEIRMALSNAFKNYLPTVAIPGKSSVLPTAPNGNLSTQPFEFLGGSDGSDDDGDSEVGVTLDFSTGGDNPALVGQVYAEFELAPLLRGRIRNSRCIEGSMQVDLDYFVIDSNIELAGAPLDTEVARQNIPSLRVLNSSTFRALRGDGEGDHNFDDDGNGDVSCEEILRHASLFQR